MSNCTLKYGSIFVALYGRGCSRLEKIESFFSLSMRYSRSKLSITFVYRLTNNVFVPVGIKKSIVKFCITLRFLISSCTSRT